MTNTTKTVLITGCSSGFGYVTSLTFARNGWTVYAGVRSVTGGARELAAVAEKEHLPLHVVKLDVTRDREISGAVSNILRESGAIDVLINNAGFGFLGPVEDFTVAEIQHLYDTNIFGMVRMTRAVLPSMRARHSGRIINISSVNGLLSFGLYGIYASSKFAVESISEALRFEVKPFGIDVVVVEPGSFLTKFHENSKRPEKYLTPDSAYTQLVNPIGEGKAVFESRNKPLLRALLNPQIVADTLFRLAGARKTRIRYKIGLDTKLYTAARKLLPDFLWEFFLHRVYKW